jgi:hypothetical protein
MLREGRMAIPKSLTDTFYSKANEGLLPSDDIQRLGADDVSRRIRTSENEELLSHDSMAGLTLRGDKWARYNDDVRTRAQEGSKKDGGIDILLMHLLDEIQRLNNELETLRRDMAVMEAGFEAEFGSEWHDAMADMYLTDAEKEAFEGLTGDARDEAILQAMKDKMLNADGSIKDEYKDTPIAVYVQMHAREKVVAKASAEAKVKIDAGDGYGAAEVISEVSTENRWDVGLRAGSEKLQENVTHGFNTASGSDAIGAVAQELDKVDTEVADKADESLAFFTSLSQG